LSDDQVRGYIIADNRLAEKAGWDKSILATELQHLINLDGSFDVTLTGFEIPEIDLIIEGVSTKNDKDDVDTTPSTVPVTHEGDLWLLDKHRVLCGNSLETTAFKSLLDNRKADLIFIDPPYNLVIDGNVCGKGAIHHREFAMASGEMNEAEFVAFLSTSFRLLAKHSKNGSIHYIFMDFRHMYELLAAGRHIYDSLLNLCVWVKDNPGMGSFYRSHHELVFVFRNGNLRHRNNVQLGQFGRNRSNIWQYPGVNTASRQSDEGNLLALHPTVKPVALVADAILDCSARGDIILNAFLGSRQTSVSQTSEDGSRIIEANVLSHSLPAMAQGSLAPRLNCTRIELNPNAASRPSVNRDLTRS
jgi:DNA modification methylase